MIYQDFPQPGWSRELYRPHDYKVIHGGRGSGKTWAVASALALQAHATPLRICVGREHLMSIRESAKPVLEQMMSRLGLLRDGAYRITDTNINHANGSHFFFIGLSKVSEEDIKGLESVDRMWVEEAHRMSQASWIMLRPTIRKDASEIWLTFNPKNRYDPVYRDFVARRNPRAWVRKVNWEDNPWFPSRSNADRIDDRRDNPERYAHIWEGEPDDISDKRKVLPYAMLMKCVDAWERRPDEASAGVVHCGLDVADAGNDKNALVGRRGPILFYADSWSAPTLGKTARRADRWAVEVGATRMHYDAGGPGGSIRSYISEMVERPYTLRGENFGGKVMGEDVLYTRGLVNKQFFHRRNAQMGWGVRLRANATVRYLEEEPNIHADQCLFINPDLKRRQDFLAQLSQPEWDENLTGKMVVDKQPEDAPSPDDYDATILAFANDSRRGLRRPK